MLLCAQMRLDWLEKLMNHLKKSKERVNILSHKKSQVLKKKTWLGLSRNGKLEDWAF